MFYVGYTANPSPLHTSHIYQPRLKFFGYCTNHGPAGQKLNATMHPCCGPHRAQVFGFLRAGKFTSPSIQAFNSHILTPQDVTVNSHQVPTILSIHLRHLKKRSIWKRNHYPSGSDRPNHLSSVSNSRLLSTSGDGDGSSVPVLGRVLSVTAEVGISCPAHIGATRNRFF